jgi:hypothetical protein
MAKLLPSTIEKRRREWIARLVRLGKLLAK